MTKDLSVILFALAVVAAILVFMPLAAIWSLNTLFALTIPFAFATWLAAFVLSAVISGSGLTFRSKK